MRMFLLAAAGAMLIGAAPSTQVDARAAFDTLRLSAQVARAGIARRDPVLLLAAARLRRSAPINLASGAADRSAEWIERAEALGGDDPRIAGLVADLRAEGSKGRADGPRVSQAVLAGGERRAFAETFRAGRPAVVYIEGDGDTDLMLKVGRTCRDIGPGDVKICAWTPARSERVTVEIGNPGRVENRVILGTN